MYRARELVDLSAGQLRRRLERREPRPQEDLVRVRASDARDRPLVAEEWVELASFAPEALCENLKALVEALNKAKPATSKGIYLQKLSVSSTMGPGIRVDITSVNA